MTCRSEALDRTALFAGGSSVASLPPYLTVQMVRFYYKADVQQKAKILRKVRVSLLSTSLPTGDAAVRFDDVQCAIR